MNLVQVHCCAIYPTDPVTGALDSHGSARYSGGATGRYAEPGAAPRLSWGKVCLKDGVFTQTHHGYTVILCGDHVTA